MPLSEAAGRVARVAPGLVFPLVLLAVTTEGMLSVMWAGVVAAQPAEALSPVAGSSAARSDPALPLVALSDTETSDGMHDDLPPSIRKSRPSGPVPADLPGRTQRDCAILRLVEVYRGIGRHTAAVVSPGDLPGVTSDGPCPPEE